jgi:geranylgeranyl pyrophosphate synthase
MLLDQYVDGVLDYATSAQGKGVRSEVLQKVFDTFISEAGLQLSDVPVLLIEAQQQLKVAIEQIHSASLVHDDVLDSAEIRRGAPSVFEKYGSSSALICGDVLFAQALEGVEQISETLKDSYYIKYALRTLRQMTQGQMRETSWGEVHDFVPDEDEIIKVIEGKTGRLFELAARFGGRLALRAIQLVDPDAELAWELADDSPEEILEETAMRALNEGIIFQLRDDIADQDEDRLNGVLTHPLLFGPSSTEALIARLSSHAPPSS